MFYVNRFYNNNQEAIDVIISTDKFYPAFDYTSIDDVKADPNITEVTDIDLDYDEPVTIEYKSEDGLFSPIKSCGATISIVSDTPLTDLYTNDAKANTVHIIHHKAGINRTINNNKSSKLLKGNNLEKNNSTPTIEGNYYHYDEQISFTQLYEKHTIEFPSDYFITYIIYNKNDYEVTFDGNIMTLKLISYNASEVNVYYYTEGTDSDTTTTTTEEPTTTTTEEPTTTTTEEPTTTTPAPIRHISSGTTNGVEYFCEEWWEYPTTSTEAPVKANLTSIKATNNTNNIEGENDDTAYEDTATTTIPPEQNFILNIVSSVKPPEAEPDPDRFNTTTVFDWTNEDYEILFKGYVTPNEYEQPYNTVDKIELECIDALSVLKTIKFNSPLEGIQSWVTVGIQRWIDILGYIIWNTGITDLEGHVRTFIEAYKYILLPCSYGDKNNSFFKLWQSTNNFYSDDEDAEPWSMYDVLEEFAKTFSLTIVPFQEYVIFVDPYNLDGNYILQEVGDPVEGAEYKLDASGAITEDLLYKGTGATISYEDYYDNIKINDNFYNAKTVIDMKDLFKNMDFEWLTSMRVPNDPYNEYPGDWIGFPKDPWFREHRFADRNTATINLYNFLAPKYTEEHGKRIADKHFKCLDFVERVYCNGQMGDENIDNYNGNNQFLREHWLIHDNPVTDRIPADNYYDFYPGTYAEGNPFYFFDLSMTQHNYPSPSNYHGVDSALPNQVANNYLFQWNYNDTMLGSSQRLLGPVWTVPVMHATINRPNGDEPNTVNFEYLLCSKRESSIRGEGAGSVWPRFTNVEFISDDTILDEDTEIVISGSMSHSYRPYFDDSRTISYSPAHFQVMIYVEDQNGNCWYLKKKKVGSSRTWAYDWEKHIGYIDWVKNFNKRIQPYTAVQQRPYVIPIELDSDRITEGTFVNIKNTVKWNDYLTDNVQGYKVPLIIRLITKGVTAGKIHVAILDDRIDQERATEAMYDTWPLIDYTKGWIRHDNMFNWYKDFKVTVTRRSYLPDQIKDNDNDVIYTIDFTDDNLLKDNTLKVDLKINTQQENRSSSHSSLLSNFGDDYWVPLSSATKFNYNGSADKYEIEHILINKLYTHYKTPKIILDIPIDGSLVNPLSQIEYDNMGITDNKCFLVDTQSLDVKNKINNLTLVEINKDDVEHMLDDGGAPITKKARVKVDRKATNPYNIDMKRDVNIIREGRR